MKCRTLFFCWSLFIASYASHSAEHGAGNIDQEVEETISVAKGVSFAQRDAAESPFDGDFNLTVEMVCDMPADKEADPIRAKNREQFYLLKDPPLKMDELGLIVIDGRLVSFNVLAPLFVSILSAARVTCGNWKIVKSVG